MTELRPGIYERLITESLRAQLDELAKHMPVDERPLNSADASDRIAWHVSQQVQRALTDLGDEQRVRIGLQVARALLDRNLTLSDDDLTMIVEALGCYEYWDLGQRLPRTDGAVFIPGDYLGADDPHWPDSPTDEESTAIVAVRASRALGELLQALIE